LTGNPAPFPEDIVHRTIYSTARPRRKDSAGEVFVPYYFDGRAEFVRFHSKESQNGLESTEDRRSAGRHGNQHVCLRRPQVGGSKSILLEQGGLPGVTRLQGRDLHPASTFEVFEAPFSSVFENPQYPEIQRI
jgi:hypothetical protein